jgi:uncharacterized Zn finger protein
LKFILYRLAPLSKDTLRHYKKMRYREVLSCVRDPDLADEEFINSRYYAMQFPLKRFNECLDEAILKRGLTYFRNGKVHEPHDGAPGEFEAVVEGTEPYTVRLQVDHDVVVEHECSCPYDAGPVCKHVAAVLFYLQKDELGLKVKKATAKADGAKKPAKRKTVAERVDALLETVDPGDLKQFVREQASQNVQFLTELIADFRQRYPQRKALMEELDRV